LVACRQNKTREALVFGPEPSVSVANTEDNKRYGVLSHGQWASAWIKERMIFGRSISVLEIDRDGIFVDFYERLNQPHPFHNVISISGKRLPFYARKSRVDLDELTAVKDGVGEVCCFDRFNHLNRKNLITFLTFIKNNLKNNGQFIQCSYRFLNCDTRSEQILRDSKPMKRRGKQISFPKGPPLDLIRESAGGLQLKNESNAELVRGGIDLGEGHLLNDPRVLKQNCLEVFSEIYPDSDQKFLKVSPRLSVTVVGVWMVKKA